MYNKYVHQRSKYFVEQRLECRQHTQNLKSRVAIPKKVEWHQAIAAIQARTKCNQIECARGKRCILSNIPTNAVLFVGEYFGRSGRSMVGKPVSYTRINFKWIGTAPFLRNAHFNRCTCWAWQKCGVAFNMHVHGAVPAARIGKNANSPIFPDAASKKRPRKNGHRNRI